MQGFKSSRRTLIKKADCTPGVYIVWCQIHYSAQF